MRWTKEPRVGLGIHEYSVTSDSTGSVKEAVNRKVRGQQKHVDPSTLADTEISSLRAFRNARTWLTERLECKKVCPLVELHWTDPIATTLTVPTTTTATAEKL